jgi:hypothetical protein
MAAQFPCTVPQAASKSGEILHFYRNKSGFYSVKIGVIKKGLMFGVQRFFAAQ